MLKTTIDLSAAPIPIPSHEEKSDDDNRRCASRAVIAMSANWQSAAFGAGRRIY
jgi:hypothetical protein